MARVLLRDLTPGTDYQLQFRANSADDISEWSQIFYLTTDEDALPPDTPAWAPTSALVADGTSFIATWQPLNFALDQNKDFDYYELELSAAGKTFTWKISNTFYVLTFEENNNLWITPTPVINARVRAVDLTGNASAWSASIQATNPLPNAPSSITSTAAVDQISLVWTASTSDDVIGYRVYTGSTSGFTPSAGNKIFEGNALAFSYTTATYSAQWFKVTAVDVFGQESAVATATASSATPVSPYVVDVAAPAVPVWTTGSSSLANNANSVGARATVVWTQTLPSPNDLSGFEIRYRKVGDTVYDAGGSYDSATRSAVVSVPLAFTDYEFQIRSRDNSANYSAWSTTMTLTGQVNTVPANVGSLTATAAERAITFSWSAVADTDLKNYELQVSTNSGFTGTPLDYLTGTSTTLTVSGLSTNTQYWARVRAVDSAGQPSAAWTALTGTSITTGTYASASASDGVVPATPGTPTVTPGPAGSLYITWSPVTTNASAGPQNDQVTYEVHVSTSSGFAATPGGATRATEINGTSAIVDALPGTTTPLTYGTTYYVKLIAKDRDGAQTTASAQGSGAPSKVASTDVTSIGADILIPGSAFITNLVMGTGGSIQSTPYTAGSVGWKISTTGIEMNDAGSTIKVEALEAGVIGGSSGAGLIDIAAGTSLRLNGGTGGGKIYSNTYNGAGTAYDANATAGFYLGSDGLVVAQGAIKAESFAGGTFSAATITMGTGGIIQTAGYNGTSGFKLSSGGLEIPDGSLVASKLSVQSGAANMLPSQYSDFEFDSAYYTTTTGGSGTGSYSISSAQAFAGTQSLSLSLSTTAGTANQYREYSGNAAAYVPVEPGNTYIVSAYVYQSGGVAGDTNFGLVVDGVAFGGTNRYATTMPAAIPSAGGWVRMSGWFTAGASETSVRVKPRFINPSTTAFASRVFYVDAVMIEEKMTNSITPSTYVRAAMTEVDGGFIRTGQIQSNTNVTVNGVTVPAWSINMGGYASFAGAQILGNTVLGNGSSDPTSIIQSSNYVAGSTGWGIRANGSAEFQSGTFRGTINATGGNFTNTVTIGTAASTTHKIQSYNYNGSVGWMIDASGNAFFANGTFNGTVNASSGSFTGAVTATSGSFTGTVNASSGTFTGTVNANAGTFTNTVTIGNAASTTHKIQSYNFNSTNGTGWQIDAAGNATFYNGTFNGTINASSGNFSGTINSSATISGGAFDGNTVAALTVVASNNFGVPNALFGMVGSSNSITIQNTNPPSIRFYYSASGSNPPLVGIIRSVSTGGIGIADSGNTLRLTVDGSGIAVGGRVDAIDGITANTDGTGTGFIDSSFTTGTTTTASVNTNGRIIRTSSSKRYKSHIKALAMKEARKVLGLESVTFMLKDEAHMKEKRVTYPGFIAEQVHESGATLWVNYMPDGRPDGVRYPEITAAHNMLIKELYEKIDLLEAKIDKLTQ